MQPKEIVAMLESYKAELEGILSRFEETRDGVYIDSKDDPRFREIVLELRDLFDDVFVDSRRHTRPLIEYFSESISNYIGSPSRHGVGNVKGVVTSALARVERNPSALRQMAPSAKLSGKKDAGVIAVLAERLHLVVRQLRQRREGRSTLDVADEYDVQDLFHALLTIYFDDIRKEEWVPSYAGGASRMDYFLPEIDSVLELKMTRRGLSTNQLGEQLIVDIAKYSKHPGCRRLFCVVYDPEARISNPRGVENDLRADSDQMTVRVMIVPT